HASATVKVHHGPGRVAAYRQGVLSNLGNPKMAVFFSSLLPQFIAPGHASFARLLMLGLLFNVMTLTWLTGYALVVARVGDVLRRDRVRRSMGAVTGLVLIGLAIRLGTECRCPGGAGAGTDGSRETGACC